MYKLYFVSRTDAVDYDEFDSFVVSAKDEDQARYTRPLFQDFGKGELIKPANSHHYSCWTDPTTLSVVEIGNSNLNDWIVICSSFNAG